MSWLIPFVALLTGVIAGSVFGLVGVPIPAPPELSGLLGIVGIFVGYRAVEYLGWGIDLLSIFGL